MAAMRSASLLLMMMAATAACAAPPPDARYRVEVLAEGMPQPMELECAPDGRIFFIEIAGLVKIWKPESRSVVEAGRLEVETAQENGLLGFALDPRFAENGWVYFLHSPKDMAGQRLSRFTMRGDQLDMASGKTILTFGEQRRECCHHAGSVEFGPDGNLFISTGDNTHPHGDSAGYAPLDGRPGMEPWDAQKSAANPADLRGKILRIRPTAEGGYTIPSGNLFPPGTPGTRPEIYCMGCRNPWRMSVDAATGIVYWGEVGPDAGGDGPRGPRGHDEINQARQAGNFGWPYFIADNQAYAAHDYATGRTSAKFDPAHPRNDGVNNTGAKDLPPAVPAFIWYPYGPSERFPEVGQGGRTACAGPVFRFRPEFTARGGFPAHFDNCLLWWDWERRFVKWARLDKDAKLVAIEPFTAAVPMKRMLDAQFDDDGRLVCLDYGETWGANADARLLRVSFVHGNLPPVAAASAQPASGAVPLTVRMSSGGSADPDGEGAALRCEWRDAAGKVLSTEPHPTLTFAEPGNHTVTLRVTDAAGGEATAAVTVTAGNTPPEVSLLEPRDGDFLTEGRPVRWRAAVRDAEEGDSSGSPDNFGPRLLVSAALDRGGEEAPGLALMKRADCFNCHAPEHRIVGPAFLEIAERYRGQEAALEASVDRVQRGSSGVWGAVPMLPHGHHTRDQIREMVQWVFALRPGADRPVVQRGLEGEFSLPPAADGAARLRIEAVFADAGNGAAGPLHGRAVATLRPRRIEAEACDERHGTQALGGASAGGGKFIGDTHHGQWLRFAAIRTGAVSGVTVRAASAGQGGRVEFRAGKPDGPLLAALDVPVTGGWETWQEIKAPFTRPEAATSDVFLVFRNPGRGGLMNVDWVRFDP